MKEHRVTIGTTLVPDPIVVVAGDTIVWSNTLAQPQTASSTDGGQTFTTGPIQPGANSLPITFSNVAAAIAYTCQGGLAGTVTVTAPAAAVTGFAATIKPYFTPLDRAAMMDANHTFGIITFDLWSRADCEANWQAIRDAIANGSMPPPGEGSDGPWPAPKIQQFVADFTRWKTGGFQP